MPYDNSSIAEFREGDARVFKAIYETHFKSLCMFAKSMVKQVHQAEDIVVETFAKLWAKHATFDSLEKVKPWLYLTTRNSCLNFLRKVKREKEAQEELSHATGMSEEENSSFYTITSDVFQKITDAIDSLPKRCRKVFKCYFSEGLTTEEIAQRLNISQNTVRNQKARAVILIREKVFGIKN